LNRIPPPQKSTDQPNKPAASPATESQTAVRLPSELTKFLPTVISPAKFPDESFMESVSETDYLLPRLAMLAALCQVLFLFYILFFDARSLRRQIMIAWRSVNIADGKRFPVLPIAWITIARAACCPQQRRFRGGNA
jgi:hypothetical protein